MVHQHNDHHTHHAIQAGTVIESICPVCNYEICASDVFIQDDAGHDFIFQDISRISSYVAPYACPVSLSYLLRAPPFQF
jgi:hypothetical protein